MIKAIETSYAGCRFRSRLEARWAVFLDAMGIAWEYEAQGFETSAGPYLPDFRVLPANVEHSDGTRSKWNEATCGEVYLEVKGGPLSLYDAERIRAFACDPGEPRWVLALGPIPDPRMQLHCLKGWGMGGAGRGWLHEPIIRMEHPYNSHETWGPTKPHFMDFSFQRMGMGFIEDDRYPNWYLDSPTGRALTAARSARFEHGQSGALK